MRELDPPGWGSSRRAIFLFQLFYVAVLGGLAIVYFVRRDWLPLPDSLGPVPVAVPWYGALGAVLISTAALADHRHDWDPHWKHWHWSRPFVGAAVGTVSVVIFMSGILAVGSNPQPKGGLSNLFYYVIAFVVGFREETFRSLLKKVADIILAPSGQQTPPGITSLDPPSGPSAGNNEVVISGSGLTNTQAVSFGGTEASFRNVSDTQVIAISPPSPTPDTVTVTVSTGVGTAAGRPYVYT